MFTIDKRIARVGVVLAMTAMAGCSSTPTYPPAPAQTGSYDWNYLVGPGDSVQVFVWRNPEVSGSFPVRPDGKMTMNLVEDIQASGKTPSQLGRGYPGLRQDPQPAGARHREGTRQIHPGTHRHRHRRRRYRAVRPATPRGRRSGQAAGTELP